MKQRWMALTAAIMLGILSICMTGYAATKISSVSVKFEAEEFDDDGVLMVEADISTDHCEGMVYPAMYYDESTAYDNDPSVYVVSLTAEDGYYFPVTTPDKYRVRGLGAEYLDSKRYNSGEELVLFVRLTQIADKVEDVENVAWQGNGRGSWRMAYGAKLYEVNIQTPSGGRFKAETAGTIYDFSPYMQTAGQYTFKVRPISMSGKNGSWEESPATWVSEETAAANKAMYEVQKETSYENGEVSPNGATVTYFNVGWQTTEDGRYWYRNTDGSYVQENWISDGTGWYYCDGNGYMKTDAYITYGGQSYYVGTDGKMITNAQAPNGHMASADGILN